MCTCTCTCLLTAGPCQSIPTAFYNSQILACLSHRGSDSYTTVVVSHSFIIFIGLSTLSSEAYLRHNLLRYQDYHSRDMMAWASTTDRPAVPENLSADRHMLNSLARRVLQAVEEYKKRMRIANEMFINQRIAEIHRIRDTELSKLNMMARFWHRSHRWPLSHPSPVTHSLRQANLENEYERQSESVTQLDDVRTLPHPYMEGLLPKTLSSPRAVDVVLKALEEVAREKSDNNITRGLSMSVPDDVRCFLEITDGVRDADFRNEGMCQWSVWDSLATEEELDPDVLQETARSHFESILVPDPQELSPMIRGFLEVAVAFYTRDGTRDEGEETWSSYYLFCRDIRFPNRDRNEGWAWRIVFLRKDDNPPWPGTPVPVCENVFDLLTWYTAWINSPHLEEMIRTLYEEESDPDQDPLELRTFEGLTNHGRS